MLGRRRRLDVDFRRRVDRWLFRLPLVGRGYRILVNMRFARTLSILLDGGVPLIDGMVLAGRATGSCWIGHLVELEAESVRHGGRLSDAVRRIPPLSEWLPGWILIGEASGGMSRLVESAGQRYQQWWERFTSRCLSVVEPALILLIGGFVLLVTVSVLLPVISLSQSVVR
jgi:type II secretory pathway component PulF